MHPSMNKSMVRTPLKTLGNSMSTLWWQLPWKIVSLAPCLFFWLLQEMIYFILPTFMREGQASARKDRVCFPDFSNRGPSIFSHFHKRGNLDGSKLWQWDGTRKGEDTPKRILSLPTMLLHLSTRTIICCSDNILMVFRLLHHAIKKLKDRQRNTSSLCTQESKH